MRKNTLIGVFIILCLSLNLSSVIAADIMVNVDGQSATGPVPRALWEGHHVSVFFSPLFKRIEVNLHKSLPIKQIRSSDSELRLEQISIAEGQYDWTIVDRFLDNINTLRSSDPMNLFFTIGNMPRWLADSNLLYFPRCAAYANPNPIYSRPSDYNKWATVVRDVVRYVKNRVGDRIVYYEVWNEPESNFWPCQQDRLLAMDEYAKLYQFTVDAIKGGSNPADPNGKVGGPAIALENDRSDPDVIFLYFDRFLARIQSPRLLPLDFVSWHRYYQATPYIRPAPPSIEKADADTIKFLLSVHGRDPNTVELIKSEWNRSTMQDFSNTGQVIVNNETEARFGAALPAHYYFMIEGRVNRSFLFASQNDTPDNGAPENFITRWPETPEEKVRPNYNVLRIMNVLTGNRVSATSNDSLLGMTGEGVNVLASTDGVTFNIVIWNYREDTTAASVNIQVMATYPNFLAGQALRFRRYLVDPQTSNWKSDPNNDHLQNVENLRLDPATSYNHTFNNVGHNSVMLLTFCLDGTPCSEPLPSPPFAIGPKIRNLFVEKTTNDTAYVSWDTPTTSSSLSFFNSVEYRPKGSTLPWTPTGVFQDSTTHHTAIISGLAAGQTYQIRSRTTDLTVPGCQPYVSCPETISEEWLTFTMAANANQTIYAFAPTDDTFLFCPLTAPPPTGSFCQSIGLSLALPAANVYLKFNVGGVNGTVQRADVRLFNIDPGLDNGLLHKISNVTWAECGITCQSRPDFDPCNSSGCASIGPTATLVNPGVSYDYLNVPLPSGSIASFGIEQQESFALAKYASRDNGTTPPPPITGPRGFYPPPTLYVTTTNPNP